MSMALGAHFFSPPAHLCAVTYITEISLHVTLSNQSHSLTLMAEIVKAVCPKLRRYSWRFEGNQYFLY